MEESNIAGVVFIILAISALGLGLALALEIMHGFGKESPVKKDYSYYMQKQEIENAFSNLAKAYEDCAYETECVCDIYKLRFPSKYGIKIENAGNDIKLTLMENDKPLVSRKVRNINTGLMQRKEDKGCGMTGAVVVHPDKNNWYLQEEGYLERHFLLGEVEEIYKPNAGTGCLLTETMLLRDNATKEGLEDYFGIMPRCSFKKKKKEELALASFRKFTDEFDECMERAKEGSCVCGFSRISLPDEYEIRAGKEGNSTLFTLVKKKSLHEGEKEVLSISSRASLLLEYPDVPDFHETTGCISTEGYHEECNEKNSAVKMGALFYSNGSRAGILQYEKGIVRIGEERMNRADIEPCIMPGKNAYELLWPAEKLNNVYYAGECFGNSGEACSKGMGMPQKPGSTVFAAEEGVVEYISGSSIRLRHKKGIRTLYENIKPAEGIALRSRVTRGQRIGAVGNGGMIYFSLTDSRFDANLLEEKEVCRERENKSSAIAVFSYGVYYSNPICYFSEGVRESIVYPNKCGNAFIGCGSYGNEQAPRYEARLKVLAIPVNWERKLPYLLYANDALEKFLSATPLGECPRRFSKIFADGATDYGGGWKGGSCIVESRDNCLVNALAAIKQCAEQYKERTGEDYDFVLGVEDSNIANYPECNFADRGWTSEKSDAAIVESANSADTLHELGHKFGLKDQYCDCSGTEAEGLCGFRANPNPLRKELGCGEKCCVPSGEFVPYKEGCRWCSGNIDMKGRDTNSDSMLDSGRRTAMSNFIDADSYSIDEYLLMKSSAKLQCT